MRKLELVKQVTEHIINESSRTETKQMRDNYLKKINIRKLSISEKQKSSH